MILYYLFIGCLESPDSDDLSDIKGKLLSSKCEIEVDELQ